VAFSVRHLGLLRVRGRFESFSGAVVCDHTGTASIRGSVSVATIDTGESKRDARLRTADFFDVERHPTIAFAGTVPPSLGAGSFEVSGSLTIKSVSRPLTLAVRSARIDGGVSLRAEGSLSRSDFGLKWDRAFAAGGLVIDDRVRLALDVVVFP
jgi:polyisoprenoid-binding protein YceI